MKLNVGISMDEIVQLPGPWVKLRPEEARLKWLFGAVRLTSVFSGTEVTADAAMDSYKRSAAASAHRTSVDPNASTSRSGIRLGPSPGQRLNAGMVALATNQSGPDLITAARTIRSPRGSSAPCEHRTTLSQGT